MPFQIVRNDITAMQADAIVNTANPRPLIGAGTDAAIHQKAGPALLEARKAIGPIRPGTGAITPGFGLDAKYVIHTVGPVWRGGLFGEAKLLRSCYESALALAWENGCGSIAFPLISSGNYGFPKDKALAIAIQACSDFLLTRDMDIFLVVWDKDSFRLSEKLFRDVASYIDEHYIARQSLREYAPQQASRRWEDRDLSALPPMEASVQKGQAPCCPAPMAAPKPLSLKDLLRQTDAGFSETLLKLIDKTGKKDSQIYKKANLSKQHFSKIRNNPDYKPTKSTAIALAIALELDLEQTKDFSAQPSSICTSIANKTSNL